MKECLRLVVLVGLVAGALASVGCRSRSSPVVDALVAAEEQRSFVVPFSQTEFAMEPAEAYDVQDRYVKAINGERSSVVGYKIAYASEVSRVRAGMDKPVFGQLTSAMQVPEGGSVVRAGFRRFAIEAEVALVMGRTIDKPIETVDDIRPYVATAHAALDLPDLPFDYDSTYTGADMIAANTAAYRFAIGPARDVRRIDFDRFEVTLVINERTFSRAYANEVMGSPLQSLVWLQQQLAEQGKTLQAGQIVLTGAPARAFVQEQPSSIVFGEYTATAGPLGQVTVIVR